MNVCAGCRKPIASASDGVTVALVPGAQSSEERVLVHIDLGSTRSRPRESCLRRARERNPRCQICGIETRPGAYVCRECHEAALRGRARHDDRDLEQVWVACSIGYVHGLDSDARRDLDRAFARAVQGEGHWVDSCFDVGMGRYVAIDGSQTFGGSVSASTPAVEVHRCQIEPLKRLVGLLREDFDATYAAGVERGRDLLGQLAEGKITVRDFEEKRR